MFLHHCVEAGLDAAIVNTEQLVRFPTLDPDEVRLAEAVLFEGDRAAVDAFVARYRQAPPSATSTQTAGAPARGAAASHGRRGRPHRPRGAPSTSCSPRMAPLAIINGPLMAGMDEVGRLFGSG